MASPSAPGPSTASTALTSPSAPGPSASSSSAPTGPSGSGSGLEISDEQKRWVVVGIGMHSVLLPALLDVVRQEISQFYLHLTTTQNIDTQVGGAYIKKDGSFQFNYDSINNNRRGRPYDYRVTSAEDLGKLYLQPHMAKFTGFDNTCDLSAVLGILANASVFHTSVQDNAKKVRSDVRNEWGHCNFDHWSETKYTDCFTLMKTLVTLLKLPTEKEICSDLQNWEENGLQLCFDGPLNKDLVKLVSNQVANLEVRFNEFQISGADEVKKINDALQKVRSEFDKLCERMEKLEERMEKGEERMETLEERADKSEEEIRDMRLRQDQLEVTVSSIKDSRHVCNITNSAKIVPFQVRGRNPNFCGRDNELETITAHLKEADSGCAQSAICGLGGVGKTSLAVEYLYRHEKEYAGGIFWVSGESDSLFKETVADLAKLVGTFVAGDFRETLKETIRYLQRLGTWWCLVVDNLDLQVLSDDMCYLLRNNWNQGARGHVIITTRREAREVAELIQMEGRCCITLNCLTVEGSIQFLRKYTERSEGEDSEIRELVFLLDALPLALEQAARYIRRAGCSFAKYVERFKSDEKMSLLEKGKERGVKQNERSAVHKTWLLNFELIRNDKSYGENIAKAAIFITEVCAFLRPDKIPYEIFNEGEPPVDVEDDVADVLRDSSKSGEILDLLTNFSLFQRRKEDFLSVHRLVQQVIREVLVKDRAMFVLCCAESLVMGVAERCREGILERAFISNYVTIMRWMHKELNKRREELEKSNRELEEVNTKRMEEFIKKMGEMPQKMADIIESYRSFKRPPSGL